MGIFACNTHKKHLSAMKRKRPEKGLFSLCTCSATDGTRAVFAANELGSVLKTELHR